MEPDPCARITGATACMPSSGPVWFTAITRSQTATDVFVIVAHSMIPALFTNTSTRPVSATTACHDRGPTRRLGDVVGEERPARLRGGVCATRPVEIGEVHDCAGGRENRG